MGRRGILLKLLKLDLDGKNGLSNFMDRIWIIKYLGLAVKRVYVHHTVNGFHVRLLCDNKIEPLEQILIQSLLGDDFKRALCNFLKFERGSKTSWNPMFKRKWATDKLGQEIEVSRETYDKELSQKVMKLIQLGE